MPKKKSEPVATKAKSARKTKPKIGKLPPYNVVLLNDDDHTYQYVIEMLRSVFGHPVEKGYQLAREVDTTGRVVVLTTHRELAELKCQQIHTYGADPLISACRGSMTAVVEPV